MHVAQLTLDLGATFGAASPSFIEAQSSGALRQTAPTARVRARRTDPSTSHEAAANAERFAGSHSARIARALDALSSATAHEISVHTGLSVVQVDRRMVELERAGKVRVLMVGGKPLVRSGFRVWARVG